jgi:hypothetical protein
MTCSLFMANGFPLYSANKEEYSSRALCLTGGGSTVLFHHTSHARFLNAL